MKRERKINIPTNLTPLQTKLIDFIVENGESFYSEIAESIYKNSKVKPASPKNMSICIGALVRSTNLKLALHGCDYLIVGENGGRLGKLVWLADK